MVAGCNCPALQYPSLFTVEGEWVSITQTIKVNIKIFYNIKLFSKIYYDTQLMSCKHLQKKTNKKVS